MVLKLMRCTGPSVQTGLKYFFTFLGVVQAFQFMRRQTVFVTDWVPTRV